MDTTHEITRLTIEQIFTARDGDTIHHSRGGLDPWDDGEGLDDGVGWVNEASAAEAAAAAASESVPTLYHLKAIQHVKWEQVAGDNTWVRTVRPVRTEEIKETREVSGEEWFLNKVVEKKLIGSLCLPHDVWVDVIVPLAIAKKRKKMTCLVMSDKKLHSRIRRMTLARDLRFQLSRNCVRLPTADCINYGRLMVFVLNPTTFSNKFVSIEGGIDSLINNDLLKIGSLEFVWTIASSYEGLHLHAAPRIRTTYSHQLKQTYTFDDMGYDDSWYAVINEIDNSSEIKIRAQAIEQNMSFEQILHIFMKRNFNLDS